jgi:hypothetical protein
MGDLYLKEDPFNSLEVDRNVEPSVKESVNINAETTKADNVKASEETSAAEHSTENSDKGNFIESLKTGVAESAEILGLNDKNTEKHNSVDDGSKLGNDSTGKES